MSALGGLPSFSTTAFSNTKPQCVYREISRIRSLKDPKPDVATTKKHQPTLTRHPVLPEVKSTLFINGVDPRCRNVVKFNSANAALPFLYSDSTTHSLTSQTLSQKPPDAEPGPSRERKRPSGPRENVDVTVQPERKRPKLESQRRAEAAARQRDN